MTIQLEIAPEVTTFAEELAKREGVSVEEFLSKTLEAFVLEEQREDALILERLAQADRGEFLTEEEMQKRFQRMLQPK
jgi:predicted transcriptional regulator